MDVDYRISKRNDNDIKQTKDNILHGLPCEYVPSGNTIARSLACVQGLTSLAIVVGRLATANRNQHPQMDDCRSAVGVRVEGEQA